MMMIRLLHAERLLSLLVVLSGLTFVRNLRDLSTRQLTKTSKSTFPLRGGTGGFIHIGKTGGSTLSLLLRNGCHSFLPKPCRTIDQPESRLSQSVTMYYHIPDFQRLPGSLHSFYVLTLRDPFDRTDSAFTYDHPANEQAQGRSSHPKEMKGRIAAYKCFPSLEIFAQHIGDNPHNFTYNKPPHHLPEHPNCKTFAKAVLAGKVRIFHHLYFNYQAIWSLLPKLPKPTLMATRKEHLYEDWSSINQVLGDTTSTTFPPDIHERQVHNLMVGKQLSETGRRRLCQALSKEYQVYFRILKQAINLSPDNLQEAIQYAHQNCPGVPSIA